MDVPLAFQNVLKIVINFYFWYIGCNLGGDDEEFI